MGHHGRPEKRECEGGDVGCIFAVERLLMEQNDTLRMWLYGSLVTGLSAFQSSGLCGALFYASKSFQYVMRSTVSQVVI